MSRRSRSDSTTEADGLESLPEGELPELHGITVDELQPGEQSPPGDEAPPEGPAVPTGKAEPAPARHYVVAPGRSLTVRRGHLNEGALLRPTDLSAEQVSDLVASGHLVAR